MSNQLIFRQERAELFETDLPAAFRFVFCNGITDGLRVGAALLKCSGVKGFTVDLLKLMTPSRCYACLLAADRVVSECYIVLSHCRHYDVEKGAAVLGPVWTDEEQRGRGLGTCLLKMTMNHLIHGSRRIFYIDTSDQNIAMQHVIENCAFGPPIKKMQKKGSVVFRMGRLFTDS